MKHINFHLKGSWLLLAICLLCTISCRKDIVDEFTPVSERWEDVEHFLESVDLSHTVSVPNAETEFVIEIGNDLFHFDTKSFKDDTGAAVSGAIKLRFIPISKSGEVILNNLASTTTVEEILHSKALYKIEAEQDGNKLSFNPAADIRVYIPSTDQNLDSEATFEWIDDSGNKGWFPTVSFDVFLFNWDITVNSINYQGEGYKLYVNQAGWVHLANYEDLLYPNSDDFGTMDVTVPEEFNNSSSRAYVAYSNEICAIPLTREGNIFRHDRILINREMQVIFISTIDEELYFGKKHIVTGSSNSFSINPSKTDFIELYTNLKKL